MYDIMLEPIHTPSLLLPGLTKKPVHILYLIINMYIKKDGR